MARAGPVRRQRVRMFRLPSGAEIEAPDRAPFDPPILSVSGRALRLLRVSDEDPVGDLTTLAVEAAEEELFYLDGASALHARLEDERHLVVRVRSLGLGGRGEVEETRRLLRIPLGAAGTDGRARYLGRWEHGKDRAVLSPKGAGVVLGGAEAITVGGEPVLVDTFRGDGLLLALKNVANGVRVVAADGVEGVAAGDVLSEIQVPEVERGPAVEVHPREALLAGFPPLGFRGDFAGLPFGGFARALGEGSADLARFLKRSGEPAFGAVRPLAEVPEAVDAHLEAALRRELVPKHTLGRTAIGRGATIALTDGRRYRVRAAALERLPKGTAELLVAALLEVEGLGALELRLGVPTDALVEPTPEAALARTQGFLIAFHPWIEV